MDTHKTVLYAIPNRAWPVRCHYCAESTVIDEMLDHMPLCRVRMVALEAEASLRRILTDEEIAALRERFS